MSRIASSEDREGIVGFRSVYHLSIVIRKQDLAHSSPVIRLGGFIPLALIRVGDCNLVAVVASCGQEQFESIAVSPLDYPINEPVDNRAYLLLTVGFHRRDTKGHLHGLAYSAQLVAADVAINQKLLHTPSTLSRIESRAA